jgi:hypothetical protein
LRDFLAPQTGRAPAAARKAEHRRIQPAPAIPQIIAKLADGSCWHGDPVDGYTMMKSLL